MASLPIRRSNCSGRQGYGNQRRHRSQQRSHNGERWLLPIHPTYRPGHDSVSATASGFKKYEATGIQLNVGQNYVLSVALEVGAVSQQVVVEASAVQVGKNQYGTGDRLDFPGRH